MASFGQGINPKLGLINYAPYLQGAAQGAASMQRGMEGLGAGLAQGIEMYAEKKKEKKQQEAEIAQTLDMLEMFAENESIDPKFREAAFEAATRLGDPRASHLERYAKAKEAPKFLNTLLSLGQQSFEQKIKQQQADAQTMQAVAEMKRAIAQSKANRVSDAVNPASFKTLNPETGEKEDVTIDQITGRVIGRAPASNAPPQFGALSAGTMAVQDPKTGAWKVVQIADDPAMVEKQKGRESLSNIVGGMVGNYLKLDELGAGINPNNSISQNISARISATDIGQLLGGAGGGAAQSIRDRINNSRPLLINSIRQATGMSARAMDSDKELQFYLQAASDPKRDLFSNLVALDTIDRTYGTGQLMERMLAGNPQLFTTIRGAKLDPANDSVGAVENQRMKAIREEIERRRKEKSGK